MDPAALLPSLSGGTRQLGADSANRPRRGPIFSLGYSERKKSDLQENPGLRQNVRKAQPRVPCSPDLGVARERAGWSGPAGSTGPIRGERHPSKQEGGCSEVSPVSPPFAVCVPTAKNYASRDSPSGVAWFCLLSTRSAASTRESAILNAASASHRITARPPGCRRLSAMRAPRRSMQ